LGGVDHTAACRESLARLDQLGLRRGRDDVVRETRRQRVELEHPDALAPRVASRWPTAVPGFGVLTISSSQAVVLTQSATPLQTAVASIGVPLPGTSNRLSIQ